MNFAALAIGMITLLMLAVTIYGAIMVTDVGDEVNTKAAGSVFLLLGGLTITSLFLWGLTHKIIPSPM